MSSGADPLVCAGRPRPAVLSKEQASAQPNWAGQGPAADEGVRPTMRRYATFVRARVDPGSHRGLYFAMHAELAGVRRKPEASAHDSGGGGGVVAGRIAER